MLIGPNTAVTIAYAISVIESNGDVKTMETRPADKPVEFIYGHGVLLPAVERHLTKRTKGYKSTLTLQPHEAFGDHKPELEQWYDSAKLPRKVPLQVGMKFQTQGPDGEVMSVIVKEIKGDKVLIDGNHPLAGLSLQFDLLVLGVRQATPEEIKTGTVQKQFH